MSLPLFQVDAFTGQTFRGNPAAVVLLDSWIGDDVMQAIARENNLSETAFVGPATVPGADFAIRWFTPTTEVDLCGHATLAAAHVLLNHRGHKGDRVVFESRSGLLPVSRENGAIALDFPAWNPDPVEITPDLVEALGARPSECYRSRDLLAVFESKKDVLGLRPDFKRIAALNGHGVIVTAPGAGHDFVSRFFAPSLGVDEDPVTGSAHCTLTPYWSKRLGKRSLTAHQVSKRGGELRCTMNGDRVHLAGRAVTYLEGTIAV